jgi:hypothetical protein
MHAEGPKADQPASTCEPTNSFSFSSITTSGATVSWEAVAGAASYYVHWQPVAGGTEQNTQVSGTSVVLTGLDACTAYRVRIRTRCGPTTFSAFTAWSPFETASTNPSVSIEVEEAEFGCAKLLRATTGYNHYYWSNSDTTLYAGDTSVLLIEYTDTFRVKVLDEFGCTDETSFIVSGFPFDCISDTADEELLQTVLTDSLNIRNGLKMLAKGVAGLSSNDSIKQLIRTIAVQHNQAHGQHFVFLDELQDSCLNRGINLVSVLKEIVWNYRNVSNPDTAYLSGLIPNFKVNDGLNSTLRIFISFNYLDPLHQNPSYPNWDSLSFDQVVSYALFSPDALPAYQLVDDEIVETTTTLSTYRNTAPVLQVGFVSTHRNSWVTERGTIAQLPKACGCVQTCHHPKGDKVCGGGGTGCGACDFSKCSFFEKLFTRLESAN